MKSKHLVGFSLIYTLLLAIILHRFLNIYQIQLKATLPFIYIYIGLFVIIIFSFVKYKELLNPVLLFSPMIFFYAISSIKLTDRQLALSNLTHLIIISSIISLLIGLSFPKIKVANIRLLKTKFLLSDYSKHYIFFGIFFLTIVTFLWECIRFGYIPILKVFAKDVYTDTNNLTIPFLHYFILLIPINIIWTIIFYKQKKLSKINTILILILFIFIQLNYFSRQYLFWLVINIFILYTYYKKISLNRLTIFFITLITVFFAFGYLRLSSQLRNINSKRAVSEKITMNEYVNQIAKSKYKLSILEASLVGYTTQSFSRLEYLVKQVNKKNYRGYGKYTFKPLINLLLLEEFDVIAYNDFNLLQFFIPTYAFVLYADFGIFGVIIFSFIYGLIIKFSYTKFVQKEYLGIGLWAIAVFFLLMTPFINYFHSFIIWLSWLFNYLLFNEK